MRAASFCTVILGLLVLTAGCGSGSKSGRKSSSTPEAVFIGSSQLAEWSFSSNFPDKNYVKKAVSGNSSSDMLARFDQDVIASKPQVVVIWAGENDIERQISPDILHSNIIEMRRKATAANIGVVLCTVAAKSGTSADQNPAIAEFRDWLLSYGASTSTVVADFYAVLTDGNGGIKPEYTVPNGEKLTEAAYVALTPVVSTAIANAKH